MSRRALLTALLALPLFAACEAPMLGQQEPKMKPKRLQKRIEAIAARAAPARLGVAVEDLTTRQLWTFNGDQAFPMGAAARVPILAAVMAETAAGRLRPEEILPVRDVDLSPPPSAVADAWPGRQTWSVADLEALALHGDTTALDVLTKRIGGPGAVNGWLDVQRIVGVSVDRYRRQIATEARGLASFRADWKGEAAWRRAIDAVPAADRASALGQREIDPRDTATPVGMARLLEAFAFRELNVTPDFDRLLGHDPGHLALALPNGARLVQAAGSAPPDLGVTPGSHALAMVELKDGRRVAFVIFLTRSPADAARREALIADIGRAVLEEF
ncbi:serine hydrolase [Caulobacter sp. 1776]|uniref:serine hydrolase n=1 Tax=Caulobacter sp. 1776 TaxID=3156420 RepID=UPI00339450FC